MKDIKLEYSEEQKCFDIVFNGGEIVTDTTLEPYTILQIFTRQRLEDYEQPNKFLQEGWFGNVFYNNDIGSKLEHITDQGSLNTDTATAGVNQIKTSLQFLFDLNLIIDLQVSYTINSQNREIIYNINITDINRNNIILEQGVSVDGI